MPAAKQKPAAISNESMTTREAAAYLGLKEQTLRVWRHQGRKCGPPFTKLGHKVVYRRSALDAWLAKNTVDPTRL